MPIFPTYLDNILNHELKKIKQTLNKSLSENYLITREIEKKMRKLFCLLMIELLNGYKENLNIIDDIPNFDSENYVQFKKENQDFYMDFCETQIFRQFLQNESDDYFKYFYKLQSNLNEKNKKNIFSKQYLNEIQNSSANKNRKRSISNSYKIINRLGSPSPVEIEEKNSSYFENNKKKDTVIEKKINIINDYENIFKFEETFYLYPYFLDYDSRLKVSNKYKSEFLMDLDSLNKYLFSIFNDDEDEKSKKHNLSIKSSNILINPNLFIHDVNERIFDKFRFIFTENIPETFIRYSIPDDYYNISNISYQPKKFALNLKSIILEITQLLETDKEKHEKPIKEEIQLNNNLKNQINRKIEKCKSVKRKITLNM